MYEYEMECQNNDFQIFDDEKQIYEDENDLSAKLNCNWYMLRWKSRIKFSTNMYCGSLLELFF